MKEEPVNAKIFKKQKISTHRKIYSKKDLQKLKSPKDPGKRPEKYFRYFVPTVPDLHMHFLCAGQIIDFIYATNLCHRDVYRVPLEVRGSLPEIFVAGLMWRFARKNRPKKRPEKPFFIVFGRFCEPDFNRRVLIVSRQRFELPMPAEFSEESDLGWLVIGEETTEIVCRKPKEGAFNINSIPMVEMPRSDDDGDDDG
jgi:hypothetical protein